MLDQDFEEFPEPNSESKNFYKKMSVKAGIFCGILVFFFGILVPFTLLGRKSWRLGLRQQIEKTFANNSYSEYSVGECLRLNSTISANCSVYQGVSASKKDFDSYAVIIRMPTLYGPVAAVYVHESRKKKADFIGFAEINERLAMPLKNAALNSQVEYWAAKIPSITATAKEVKNEKK